MHHFPCPCVETRMPPSLVAHSRFPRLLLFPLPFFLLWIHFCVSVEVSSKGAFRRIPPFPLGLQGHAFWTYFSFPLIIYTVPQSLFPVSRTQVFGRTTRRQLFFKVEPSPARGRLLPPLFPPLFGFFSSPSVSL